MKKIAIQIVSSSKTHAYDRRRLYPFLRSLQDSNHIVFEEFTDVKTLSLNEFDFVIINISSDLPFILKTLNNGPQQAKFILDFCDFIHIVSHTSFFIKSIFALLRRRYSNIFSKDGILRLFSLVDTIVVGSEYQYEQILYYNKNVYIIPDLLEEIKVKAFNEFGENDGIFWEGFANSNLPIFIKLFRLCSKLKARLPLYIVTDYNYYFAGGVFGKISTLKLFRILNFFFPQRSLSFSDWNLKNLEDCSEKCSIAVMPISRNIVTHFKPENKIIIMIRLGLYPIVSNIPAYQNFADRYNLKICFSNNIEFQNLILDRKNHILKLKELRPTILNDYSAETLINKWKKVIEINNNI